MQKVRITNDRKLIDDAALEANRICFGVTSIDKIYPVTRSVSVGRFRAMVKFIIDKGMPNHHAHF